MAPINYRALDAFPTPMVVEFLEHQLHCAKVSMSKARRAYDNRSIESVSKRIKEIKAKLAEVA